MDRNKRFEELIEKLREMPTAFLAGLKDELKHKSLIAEIVDTDPEEVFAALRRMIGPEPKYLLEDSEEE